MNVVIIGCGYVADLYMATLKNYKDLNLLGVYDKNLERLKKFSSCYKVDTYTSLDSVMNDSNVNLILNLTNPQSHYEINKIALESGKHVYSEKPVALDVQKARELSKIAKKKKLIISSAPCNVLNRSCQSLFSAINKDKIIGKVLLIYANFDCGFYFNTKPQEWQTLSGAKWPAKSEYETGNTVEHSAYMLNILALINGTATKVFSYSNKTYSKKNIKLDREAPDFSVGCIEYKNGSIARLTNSLLGPLDRSLTIIGENGKIFVKDIRDDNCPVYIKSDKKFYVGIDGFISIWQQKFESALNFVPFFWGTRLRFYKKYKFVNKKNKYFSHKSKPVDFCIGILDLINSVKNKKDPILNIDLAIHVLEITNKLQYQDHDQIMKTKINI